MTKIKRGLNTQKKKDSCYKLPTLLPFCSKLIKWIFIKFNAVYPKRYLESECLPRNVMSDHNKCM